MESSLSDLVDKLAEEIIKLNANMSIIGKKCVTCGISYKDYECCLEFTNIEDYLIECKSLYCNKN